MSDQADLETLQENLEKVKIVDEEAAKEEKAAGEEQEAEAAELKPALGEITESVTNKVLSRNKLST